MNTLMCVLGGGFAYIIAAYDMILLVIVYARDGSAYDMIVRHE